MAMAANSTEARVIADEVVAIVRDVLGEALIGAYLHGSAVLGGLRPSSDLDVLAVIDRSTTENERRGITKRLLEISGRRAYRGPGRPVELFIVVRSEVKPWHDAPRAELQYGEWLRDEYEGGRVPSPEDCRDLAVLIATTLAGNDTLYGPPPAQLLDPVPHRDVRRAIVAGVPGLLADLAGDTRNVLLTLARIWATLATREIVPKDVAAAWAAERLPPGRSRDVLLRARQMYLDGINDDDPAGGWAGMEEDVRIAADDLIGEIASLQPG
jgi:predicted nucleotidyltransferase